MPASRAVHFQNLPIGAESFTHGSDLQFSSDQTRGFGGNDGLYDLAPQAPSHTTEEGWEGMSSHPSAEPTPPPKPKRTRKRKPKAPLDEATRKKKREEALDKNKRAAAKCRAKKKIEEDRQVAKLRTLTDINKSLHDDVASLMQCFEIMRDWVIRHNECADVDMMEAGRIVGNIESINNRIIEDRVMYQESRKNPPRISDFEERDFNAAHRHGSEFSSPGAEFDDQEFADQDDQSAMVDGSYHQSPPSNIPISGEDLNRNSSLDLAQSTRNQYYMPTMSSTESKQSPAFVTSVDSMHSSNINAQFQGDSSYPDLLSPTFNEGYESYGGSYNNDLDLFQSSSYRSSNSPLDPMEFLQNPIDQINVSDMTGLPPNDSTYGSPASKTSMTPSSNQPNPSGEVTQPKEPSIIRRDSALGPEINTAQLLLTDMQNNQNFPGFDMSRQSRRPSLLERRRLRSEPQ